MTAYGWLRGIRRRRVALVAIPLLATAGMVVIGTPAHAQTLTVVDQFGTPSDAFAFGVAVADRSGAIYVGGSTGGTFSGSTSAGMEDGFVCAYSKSGKPTWTRQFGTAGNDYVSGVAVSQSGTVYTVGVYTAGGDGFVRAYSKSGKLEWTRQLATTHPLSVSGVAVDGTGNVYVGGSTDGVFSGSTRAGNTAGFVRSYTADGTERWTRQFDSTSPNYVNALTVDTAGNVYAAGYTLGVFSGFTNAGYQDAFVLSYTADGTERWTRQFGTTYDDAANGVVVDASGNVYVGGVTSGTFGGSAHAAATDGFVRSYTADGTERWTSQFNGPGNNPYDSANGMAVDASGNVYAAGYTSGSYLGDNYDGVVRSYTADGTERWTDQFGTSGKDLLNAVAVDGADNVYVVGDTDGAFAGFTSARNTDGFLAKIVQAPGT